MMMLSIDGVIESHCHLASSDVGHFHCFLMQVTSLLCNRLRSVMQNERERERERDRERERGRETTDS